ncbi:alpha/beta hydrolase [Paenibacillus guangzhouensis]|uniref:alpha/beta hydrolase n=1 Tax=Paenibacillus guangzhouensis TaxID=1473112 RepID=UPI0012671809|nr:alpha/beta hydrolase [Paenibacillus guangzhouensis]
MQKLLNVLKKASITLLAVILLATIAAFINNQVQLSRESALLKEEGSLAQVDGQDIHVYQEGNGQDTYVFMPGSGIAAPMYELRGMYRKFSQENKIAVVERAGYGYSDVSGDDRDIDKILEQTREALMQTGNKPPYILVPHSISGIEAIYWAQKYPAEVKGIIALDIGLPQQYVAHPLGFIDSVMVRGTNLLTALGFHRFAPSMVYNPEVLRQSFLTEQEKERYKAISYRQFFNRDMERELLQSYNNSMKSLNLPYPADTPILFLDAIADQYKDSIYTIQNQKDYHAFAAKLHLSEVKTLRGTHSIYLYVPDEIYQLAMVFMEQVKQKG